MIMKKVGAIFILLLINANLLSAKIKVLLIDGQNNHNWKATTPVMVDALEKTNLFLVTVSTSPPKKSKPDV